MIITSEYIYKNPSIDTIGDSVKTTIREHSEKYGYNDLYKTTQKGNIKFIDQTNKKTKNINVNSYNLAQRGKNTIIASKGVYKFLKINRKKVILESDFKKHVINTLLKMQKPIMWRKFFKNIAENRDYIYNYCNKRSYRFNRYCVDWYMYNVIKNNTVTNDDYAFLNNFDNQNLFIYLE